MVNDARLKAFEADTFFEDGSSARPLVKGTVARGHLKDQSPFYTGLENDQYIAYCPIPVDRQLLLRGQERFNINCSVCHGQTGEGNGMVVQRGFTPPSSFHGDRLRQVPIGHLFQVMTEGSRNMSSYHDVLDEKDRWAIAAYLRTLQRSRHTHLQEAPAGIQDQLNRQETNDTAPVYEETEE